MHTEQALVTRFLLGFGALGAISAAVPVVALVLLGLVALAALGAVVCLVSAWHATRFEVPEPDHQAPTVRRVA